MSDVVCSYCYLKGVRTALEKVIHKNPMPLHNIFCGLGFSDHVEHEFGKVNSKMLLAHVKYTAAVPKHVVFKRYPQSRHLGEDLKQNIAEQACATMNSDSGIMMEAPILAVSPPV